MGKKTRELQEFKDAPWLGKRDTYGNWKDDDEISYRTVGTFRIRESDEILLKLSQ